MVFSSLRFVEMFRGKAWCCGQRSSATARSTPSFGLKVNCGHSQIRVSEGMPLRVTSREKMRSWVWASCGLLRMPRLQIFRWKSNWQESSRRLKPTGGSSGSPLVVFLCNDILINKFSLGTSSRLVGILLITATLILQHLKREYLQYTTKSIVF